MLGVIVVLFVWNRRPVEVVAIGASLTLAATGVLTLDQSLSGFGNATVVFIAALFVVSEAIEAQPGVVSVKCPSENRKRP